MFCRCESRVWGQAAKYGNPKATTLQILLSAIAGINKVHDIIVKGGLFSFSVEGCDNTTRTASLIWKTREFVTLTQAYTLLDLYKNQVYSLIFSYNCYRAVAINHSCTVLLYCTKLYTGATQGTKHPPHAHRDICSRQPMRITCLPMH